MKRFGLILLIPALVLLTACSGPSVRWVPETPAPGQTPPPTTPSATTPGVLEGPTVLVNDELPPRAPVGTVSIAAWQDASQAVQLRWSRHLDLEQAKPHLSVTPARALKSVDWDQGFSAADGDWAMARLVFGQPAPGSKVEVRLTAGVRGKDGSTLPEDVVFTVAFVDATQTRITLAGPSYLTAGRVTVSSGDGQSQPILRPGEARLDIAFSQPVSRQAVWDLLRTQVAGAGPGDGRDVLREPVWTVDNRHLSVRLELPKPQGSTGDPFRHFYLDFGRMLDARGLPVEPQNAALSWFVAAPLRVYRSPGITTRAEPAGAIGLLPLLQPGGSASLRNGLLLTTHIVGDDGDDCGIMAPLVWDLQKGVAVPLGEPQMTCTIAQVLWRPDGKNALFLWNMGVAQFPVDTAAFGTEAAPEGARLYTPPEGRSLLGAAQAPDGRLALFEAKPTPGNQGNIDLLLLSPEGAVVQRVEGVSDLIASEGLWRPIDADWSADGATLAFLSYTRGDQSGNARVTLWRNGSLSPLNQTAFGLSWRPGTSQVLLHQLSIERQTTSWLLYDTVTDKVVGQDLPLTGGSLLWSPDGRYVATTAEGQSAVLDLETGKTRQGAFRALAWGDDDELYWLDSN